jgi:enamine deaminase RidA (YjgF/YER057c/UK114 family)
MNAARTLKPGSAERVEQGAPVARSGRAKGAGRAATAGRDGGASAAARSVERPGRGAGQGVDVAAMAVPTPENRARALGLDIPEGVTPAAHYALASLHGGLLYLSGQLPRVGGKVAVTGRVGEDVPLGEAQRAARLCTLRALGAMRQVLGSLDRVERVLKLQVFVRCSEEFQRHSEVADAASELLVQVFGAVGLAARTAVGVYQLPQGASVELDLVVACAAPAANLKEQQHAAQH